MTDTKKSPEFSIQRIYTKDVSFEAPETPQIFKKEWKPNVNLDINNHAEKIEEDLHEVNLRLTVTVKLEQSTAFVCEVKIAGIFYLKDIAESELGHVLNAFCPNILYPYARERVSSLVESGGFPPLYLAPLNFDAIYLQQQQQATNAH